MKRKLLIAASFSVLSLAIIISGSSFSNDNRHYTHNQGGTCCSTGSPGETHTCSQSGCHGAGNGSSTTGGLPDNGGPGNIQITSVPAMVGNQYVPNTLYHMSVTVSETGKPLFGFNFEALDNSGNTDIHVNNTAGTLTITDPVHTQIMQGFGTGRMTVCHKLNGGLSANSATFNFDWTSPASGTVNFYSSANACNNNGLPDAPDNVYTHYILGITPTTTTGINENSCSSDLLHVYPNPASDQLTVNTTLKGEEAVTVCLYGLEGRLVRTLENNPEPVVNFCKTYSINDVAPGVYLLRVWQNGAVQSRRVLIR